MSRGRPGSRRVVVLIVMLALAGALGGCDNWKSKRSPAGQRPAAKKVSPAPLVPVPPPLPRGKDSSMAAARAFFEAPITNNFGLFESCLLPKDLVPTGRRREYDAAHDTILEAFPQAAARCREERTVVIEVLGGMPQLVPDDMQKLGISSIRVVGVRLAGRATGKDEDVRVVTAQHKGRWFVLPVKTTSDTIR